MKEDLKPHMALSDRFLTAGTFATTMHRGQVRKSTDIPYISHPLGVASLLIEAGADEDQVIAGLLHDIAEDCGGEPRLNEIEKKFGARVASIVRGCSDSLVTTENEKAPWLDRKKAHIEHLKSSDLDTSLVTAADKTHNARAIVTDLQSIGNEVWKRFNIQTTPDLIIWYYSSMFEVLQERGVTPALLNPLRTAIGIMESFVEEVESNGN